jgi:4-hydroxybenzoate polyprenyltransferase
MQPDNDIIIGGIKRDVNPDLDKSQHGHNHNHTHHHHHHTKSNNVRRIFLRIVHSNAYLPIPLLAMVLETYIVSGNFEFDYYYLGFLSFSTLLLYPLHRIIGVKMTIPIEFTKAQRGVHKNPQLTYAAILIGLIGTVFFTTQLSFETIQLLLPLGIISIAYSLPILPTLSGWKRLRDIPGIKIYAISTVVTLTTSTIPLLLMTSISNTDILLLAVQRFLFILAITIPFDIRDVVLDKKWKLKTIPLLLGNEKSVKLAIILIHLTLVVAGIQYFITPLFGIEVLIAILISNLWVSYVLIIFRENNSPLFNAFIVEGTMVFHFAIITVATILVTLF